MLHDVHLQGSPSFYLLALALPLCLHTSFSKLSREQQPLMPLSGNCCAQDAVEKKYQDWYKKNKLLLMGGGMGALIFLLPVFLALWRFVLFGLGPSWNECR